MDCHSKSNASQTGWLVSQNNGTCQRHDEVRNHNKETKQFFYIAKGSIYEIETQMYLALDLNFINQDQTDKIFIQLTLVRKLLIGFIKYLEKW